MEFTNTTEQWGLTRRSVANGAIYADLDNDGDYDLVTNNLNDNAVVLRNNEEAVQKNNYIKIKLNGSPLNRFGIGSKIRITTDSAEIFQEAYFTRGYVSSVEPLLTIGIGKAAEIKNIEVVWTDGTQTSTGVIKPNQLVTIEHSHARQPEHASLASPNKTVLEDITSRSGLDFVHRENDFIDFKMQRLLFYQLSKLGGKLSRADVNGDGNDDVFFGGASGQAAELFFGQDDGTLRKAPSQEWETDKQFEDQESVFFDADGDGDDDLYVVSGGSEFISDAPLYQDRLYKNDGKGVFSRVVEALPKETASGSCVVAADFDKDGDQDIFVGGRHVPSNYGIKPRSYIFLNNSSKEAIRFSDATSQFNRELENIGMVTAAVATDFNGDTWPDLIVTGEWMGIHVFENVKGKLVERIDMTGLSDASGWWCSITPADIDEDGDIDFILGNAGSNLQFKPSSTEPVELFVHDFNQDGTLDPVMSSYIQGKSYPYPSRDELLDQISSFRKKFIKYADYANATISDIATEEQLKKSYRFSANKLQSCWMQNVEGKTFTLHPLPAMAQLSSIYGAVFEDFDNNGSRELLIAGNFFPYKPQLGRSDASNGLLLAFKKGQLTVESVRSDVWLTGDIRDMAVLKFKSGIKHVVVSRNNDAAGVFSFKFNTSVK
jgi:hypothetical protein